MSKRIALKEMIIAAITARFQLRTTAVPGPTFLGHQNRLSDPLVISLKIQGPLVQGTGCDGDGHPLVFSGKSQKRRHEPNLTGGDQETPRVPSLFPGESNLSPRLEIKRGFINCVHRVSGNSRPLAARTAKKCCKCSATGSASTNAPRPISMGKPPYKKEKMHSSKSSVFSVIAMMQPSDSWVSRWQRIGSHPTLSLSSHPFF